MKSDAVKKEYSRHLTVPFSMRLDLPKKRWNVRWSESLSSYNEIVPGHMNLDKIVEAVKMGVDNGWRSAESVSGDRCL